MYILQKQPAIVNPPCHRCAGATTGSTQLGQPICTQCATATVTALLQYGGPVTNLYPVYQDASKRTEFLVLAGGLL